MNKYVTLLILFSLIFSGATIKSSSIDDGKKIFDEKCKSCHEGRSDVPRISKLSQLSEKDIIYKVRNGVQGTNMRSFSTGEISDNDLNNIISYLKNYSSTNQSSSSTNKSAGFDIIFGILSILFLFFIHNKFNLINKK